MSEGSLSKLRRSAIKLLSSLSESSPSKRKSAVFQVRPHVLSPIEQTAFHALVSAGEGRVVVFPKVHLVDFLAVREGVQHISEAIRMDRKRVDFLLCDAETMEPLAVVELFSNDKEAPRPPQDPFVSRALASSGLANFRIEAVSHYPIDELRERLIRRMFNDKNNSRPMKSPPPPASATRTAAVAKPH